MAIRKKHRRFLATRERRALDRKWRQERREQRRQEQKAERAAERAALLAQVAEPVAAVPGVEVDLRTARRRVREKAHVWLGDLAKETDAVRLSDEWVNWLDACAAFNCYSFNNILWIREQFPEARRVASRRVWRQYNRTVKPDAKPIWVICAVSFWGGRVYDISQTEGDPLPELTSSVEGETPWWDRLRNGAAHLGIEIKPKADLEAGYQGRSHGGSVEVDMALPTVQRSLVLIHELAHELLHQAELERRRKLAAEQGDEAIFINRFLTAIEKGQREMEAESVAYIVAKALQLPTAAPVYIAFWEDRNWLGNRVEDLHKQMSRIQRAAQKILKAAERKRPPKPKPVVIENLKSPILEEYAWSA
ncbi:MAG: hypothetical protein KIT79_01035 [Deltaproteobacteria bacterium]|nr:hypothetical protein [Deltaproteobacteria bacterium]